MCSDTISGRGRMLRDVIMQIPYCPGDCDVVAAPDSICSSLTDNLTQVCYGCLQLLLLLY